MKNDISENIILYDWLSVSSKNPDPQSWFPLLGMEGFPWEEMEHGRNGYRKGLYYGSISIMYDGNENMGTCLEMSGQGCRTFESEGTGDFDGLFQLFQDHQDLYHVTRLDVAFDDHTGLLDMNQVYRDTDEQLFVSKFRKTVIEKAFTDGRPGITIYHGRKSSEVMFRIYDKAAERNLSEQVHWVRVEMQLRGDRALSFIQQPEPIGEKFRGVLVNYVRYVEESSDSNKWRWPMKEYWDKLIDGISRIRLYVKPGEEYNIMQLDNFVFSQAGNAIATELEILGLPEFIRRLQSRSQELPSKYKYLLNLYSPKRRERYGDPR